MASNLGPEAAVARGAISVLAGGRANWDVWGSREHSQRTQTAEGLEVAGGHRMARGCRTACL